MDEKYKVEDYGIFSDAIATTNKLKASIDSAQSSFNEVKNVVDNDSVFMGPCADSCVDALNKMNNSMTIMTENFSAINQYLLDVCNAYKAGDKDASNVILELKSADGKKYQVGAASEYANPGNLEGSQLDFVNSIIQGAIDSYNKYGVLPSITLAQAILESGWGGSSLSEKYNNLFGIKAGSNWDGKTVNLPTGEQKSNGERYTVNADFRVYDSVEDSIEDHAKLLADNDRYKYVIASKDYKEGCKAMGESGYATSLAYAENLQKVIEQYGLDQWDPK